MNDIKNKSKASRMRIEFFQALRDGAEYANRENIKNMLTFCQISAEIVSAITCATQYAFTKGNKEIKQFHDEIKHKKASKSESYYQQMPEIQNAVCV